MAYKYPGSMVIMNRALEVVPGGICGEISPLKSSRFPITAYPLFAERAKGSEIFDVDGNRFIDIAGAKGDNITGYADPDIISAMQAEAEKCGAASVASFKGVELAEKLTSLAKKDWAYFTRCGGDALTLAVRAARHFTGRKKILAIGEFIGVYAPWAATPDVPGTLPEECRNTLRAEFGDIEGIKKIVSENAQAIACLVTAPYGMSFYQDNSAPPKGYFAEIRKLCDENGIIFILDDTFAGLRLSVGGSNAYFDFESDLTAFGGALSNGCGLAALTGKNFLKRALSETPFPCELSAVPAAAAIVNLDKLVRFAGPQLFVRMGRRFVTGISSTASKLNVPLIASGAAGMFSLRIDEPTNSFLFQQEWCAECARRGLLLACARPNFLNMAISEALVDEAITIASESLEVTLRNNRGIFDDPRKAEDRLF